MTLTPRQRAVLDGIVEGKLNAEIGARLGTTKVAIMNDVARLMDATGMGSRLELALWWLVREGRDDRDEGDQGNGRVRHAATTPRG